MEKLINWLADKSTALSERLENKSRRDRGFILLSTMVVFVAVSGSVAGLLGAAQATINNSTLSREFIQAGQLTDLAVQDALYQLNQNPAYALNPQGTGFASISTPKNSAGTSNGGQWKWQMQFTTVPGGWPELQVTADGTFNKTSRHASTIAAALTVGSYKVGGDNQLSYEVSPRTAFQHVLFGRQVTAQNGAGVGPGSTFLQGNVGITGATAAFDQASGLLSQNKGLFRLYGSSAAASTIPDVPKSSVKKAPVGLFLDKTFIVDNISRCGGTVAEAWVSSKNGGKLKASSATEGNAGCYSSMTFDVPTIVEGTGSFNAFVSGGVKFNESVSMATGAALNIYTNGNVDFNTEQASSTSMDIANTFIYAPQGACNTVPFRSASKNLNFIGSIACDTINVAGKFNTTPEINPLGSEVYGSNIWYLTDYQQPSGSRG